MENEKAKRLKPNEIIKPGIFTIIDSMPACPDCYSVNIQAEVVKHGPKKTNAVHFTCKTCYCEWIVAPEDDLEVIHEESSIQNGMRIIRQEIEDAKFPEPSKEQIFFEAVKGKKIRKKNWSEIKWMLVTKFNQKGLRGLTLQPLIGGICDDQITRCFKVGTGFNPNSDGDHWEFYQEPEVKAEPYRMKFPMAIDIHKHGGQFDTFMKSPLRCPECGTTKTTVQFSADRPFVKDKLCKCLACDCLWVIKWSKADTPETEPPANNC